MRTTIELTPKATKWIFLFNGAVNSLIGYRQLFQAESWAGWAFFLSLVLMVAGPLMILYAFLLFYKSNRISPKIQVDETEILIKEDIHKPQRRIAWKNVREITYGQYELNFQLLDDKAETVTLATNAEISIEVKKAIRQFAADRQIRVIGG